MALLSRSRGATTYMSYDSLEQEHGGAEPDGCGTSERARGRHSGAPRWGTTTLTATHITCTHAQALQLRKKLWNTHKPLLVLDSTLIYLVFTLYHFPELFFMYVWLLKVSLCGPGDPKLPCLCVTPKTTRNHKQWCRRTSTQYCTPTGRQTGTQASAIYFILYQLLPVSSQLETTAANGDADTSKYVHHIIKVKVRHTGPPI